MYWVHVPRTGAVFRKHLIAVVCPRVRRMFQKQPRRTDAFVGGDPGKGPFKQPLCTYNFDVDALYGHAPFPRDAPGEALLVVVLRSPTARAVSSFWRAARRADAGGAAENAAGAAEKDATARLRAHADRCADCALKMILGFGCYARTPASKLDLGAAVARLESSAFVGISERWTDSLILLRRTFDVDAAAWASKLDAGVQRQPRPYSDAQRDAGLRALAAWRTADHDLYEVATRIFQARLDLSDDEELGAVLDLPERR